MLRAAGNVGQFGLRLRTVASGRGEALGSELYDWGRAALGLTINEFYGQTECNVVLASSVAMGVSARGAIGKPVPGAARGRRAGPEGSRSKRVSLGRLPSGGPTR